MPPIFSQHPSILIGCFILVGLFMLIWLPPLFKASQTET